MPKKPTWRVRMTKIKISPTTLFGIGVQRVAKMARNKIYMGLLVILILVPVVFMSFEELVPTAHLNLNGDGNVDLVDELTFVGGWS